jgi:hypothetical protein
MSEQRYIDGTEPPGDMLHHLAIDDAVASWYETRRKQEGSDGQG